MKNTKIGFLIIFTLLFFFGCAKNGVSNNSKITIDDSNGNFTEKDIMAAIDTVKKDFKHFKGGEMKQIIYNQKKYQKDIDNYMVENKISKSLIDYYITIYGDFKINDPGINSGFSKNSEFYNYMWILKRNRNENWKIIFSGN